MESTLKIEASTEKIEIKKSKNIVPKENLYEDSS